MAKELSEEITEGIHEGFSRVFEDLGKTLLIASGIIVALILLWSFVISPLISPDFDQSGKVASYSPCQTSGYEMLTCAIINFSESKNTSYGVSYHPVIEEIHLCGFQEANAYFEYYNKSYSGNSKLKLQCV